METITDSARIKALLQRLTDKRVLLAIKVDGLEPTFTTAIIELDGEHGIMMLDELKPESGNKGLRETKIVKARTQLDGVLISFVAKITAFGVEDGITYYRVQIPPALGYLQRRENVRIRVGAAHALAAKVSLLEEGLSAEGFVADISLGGLRINFKRDLPEAFQTGSRLRCSFTVVADVHETLHCDIIVRGIQNTSSRGATPFIGAEFIDIDRPAERQLQKLIMNLQRSMQQQRGITED